MGLFVNFWYWSPAERFFFKWTRLINRLTPELLKEKLPSQPNHVYLRFPIWALSAEPRRFTLFLFCLPGRITYIYDFFIQCYITHMYDYVQDLDYFSAVPATFSFLLVIESALYLNICGRYEYSTTEKTNSPVFLRVSVQL